MERIVPASWMPDASPVRVIVHWTGGGPSASSLDKEHYHVLVEQDLDLVRGIHTIKDNDNTADGAYAAHTKGKNTRSIGISLCGMLNSTEHPFIPGPHPIKEPQWDRAARAVAELCERYDIPVTPPTVLQHGEVQEILGVTQNGKWDVCRLPWKPSWSHAQVGEDFRNRVKEHLANLMEDESAIPIRATVMGIDVPGFLEDSQALVAMRPLEEGKLFVIKQASREGALLKIGDKEVVLTAYNIGGKGFVPARKLAEHLGAELEWNSAQRKLTIHK